MRGSPAAGNTRPFKESVWEPGAVVGDREDVEVEELANDAREGYFGGQRSRPRPP